MKVNPFWVFFGVVFGGTFGAIFHKKTQQILLLLAEILYNKTWVFLLISVVIVGCYFGVQYLTKREFIRVKAILTADEWAKLKAAAERSAVKRTHQLKQIEHLAEAKRQRLKEVQSRVFQDASDLEDQTLLFVCYVAQVEELLERRSERLKNELPANPARVEKLRERDLKLKAELRRLSDGTTTVLPEANQAPPTTNKRTPKRKRRRSE